MSFQGHSLIHNSLVFRLGHFGLNGLTAMWEDDEAEKVANGCSECCRDVSEQLFCPASLPLEEAVPCLLIKSTDGTSLCVGKPVDMLMDVLEE